MWFIIFFVVDMIVMLSVEKEIEGVFKELYGNVDFCICNMVDIIEVVFEI